MSPRASGQPHLLAVLATVAVGGVVGAKARDGLAVGLPHGPGAWAWSTLIANVTGCLLMGVLMVLVSERVRHPLVRPLLGRGRARRLHDVLHLHRRHPGGAVLDSAGPALLYLVLTPVLAVAAAAVGVDMCALLPARA